MVKNISFHWLLFCLLLPVFTGVTLMLNLHTRHLVLKQIEMGVDDKLSNIISWVRALMDPNAYQQLAEQELKTAQNGEPGLEEDPYYQQTVEWFRDIRRETGLTYLYTFRQAAGAEIVYLIDGTEGPDFTPIGDADVLPDGVQTILDSKLPGSTPLVMPVAEWENWGLMKTAFGKLDLPDESLSAWIGTDIQASILQTRKKQATLSMLMSGSLGICIAILATLATTRKIVSPVHQLRTEVLALAGGDSNTHFSNQEIREYTALSKRFKQIAAFFKSLDHQIENQLESNRTDLRESQFQRYMTAHGQPFFQSQFAPLTIRSEAQSNSYFWSFSENREGLLFWCAKAEEPQASLLGTKARLLAERFSPSEFDAWLAACRSTGLEKRLLPLMIHYAQSRLHYSLPTAWIVWKRDAAGSTWSRLPITGDVTITSGFHLLVSEGMPVTTPTAEAVLPLETSPCILITIAS
jgi:hypothetical protein